KELMPSFGYTGGEITFIIPESPAGISYDIANEADFNINDIIKSNNSGKDYSIDDVSRITIEQVTIHIENPDSANDWTNFETISVKTNTNKGQKAGKADLTASINVNDTDADKLSDKVLVFEENNLKDYVDGEGTKAVYSLVGKTRR